MDDCVVIAQFPYCSISYHLSPHPTQVLADGANFKRATVPIRHLSLTKLKVRVARSCKTSTLLKALAAAKVNIFRFFEQRYEES